MDSLPKHAPESLQPNIYAAVTITLVLAVIAVVSRFIARRLTRSPLWLDDWLVLVALATSIAFDINIYSMTKHGAGLHIETIQRDIKLIYHDYLMNLWIGELLYTFALTPAKLAFLAFYWRIFSVSSITLPIKITATIIVVMCHCHPIQGFWDKTISATCNVDDRKFFVGSVMPHLLMDLVILALPVPYIKGLNISRYQKLCIFALFLFGGFLCFASIIQIIVCFRLDTTSKDVTWNFTPIAMWAAVEVNLAVMAVCLPTLRPIYRLVINGTLKTINSSHGSTHNSESWAGSKFHVLSPLKPNYSESTNQFTDSEGNKSIEEGFVEPPTPGHRSRTTCEVENRSPGWKDSAKDVITVKEEVNVRISTNERSAGV